MVALLLVASSMAVDAAAGSAIGKRKINVGINVVAEYEWCTHELGDICLTRETGQVELPRIDYRGEFVNFCDERWQVDVFSTLSGVSRPSPEYGNDDLPAPLQLNQITMESAYHNEGTTGGGPGTPPDTFPVTFHVNGVPYEGWMTVETMMDSGANQSQLAFPAAWDFSLFGDPATSWFEGDVTLPGRFSMWGTAGGPLTGMRYGSTLEEQCP